jgi:hypothetical protein
MDLPGESFGKAEWEICISIQSYRKKCLGEVLFPGFSLISERLNSKTFIP